MPGSSITWGLFLGLLAVASVFDVTRHRIPNAIVVSTAVVGLLFAILRAGGPGVLHGLGALALTFAVLLPAWRVKMIGGGDLKLAAAAAIPVGLGGLFQYALASGLALGGSRS